MQERERDDLHGQLDDLRDAVEERGQAVDDTFDALAALSRSLEDHVARQRHLERRLSLNSFAAYVLFTALLGGAFFLLYQSRAGELVAAREKAVAERNAAEGRFRELATVEGRRQESETQAMEFYELLRRGEHARAVETIESLRELDLSPVEMAFFEDGVKTARESLRASRFQAGVAAFRRGDFDRAAAELLRSLEYADGGPREAEIHHHLGLTRHRQGQQEAAIKELEAALAQGVSEAGIEDTGFFLATALAQSGRMKDARVAFEKFAAEHPGHRLALPAERRAIQLARAARQQARAAAAIPE